MKKIFLIIAFVFPLIIVAQISDHKVIPLGHAHNDYEHNIPFKQAYNDHFGSIEADVFLIHDSLYVAHEITKLLPGVLLGNAYLQPLSQQLEKFNGYPYADTTVSLQLLIDVKLEAQTSLKAIIHEIEKYPFILSAKKLQITITGNQPAPESFTNYPSYIYFDGKLEDPRYLKVLNKIALFSVDFKNYSKWNGIGKIPNKELEKIKWYLKKAHALDKPVRFWDAPDTIHSWLTFSKLGINFINTDHVDAFEHFVDNLKNKRRIKSLDINFVKDTIK